MKKQYGSLLAVGAVGAIGYLVYDSTRTKVYPIGYTINGNLVEVEAILQIGSTVTPGIVIEVNKNRVIPIYYKVSIVDTDIYWWGVGTAYPISDGPIEANPFTVPDLPGVYHVHAHIEHYDTMSPNHGKVYYDGVLDGVILVGRFS